MFPLLGIDTVLLVGLSGAAYGAVSYAGPLLLATSPYDAPWRFAGLLAVVLVAVFAVCKFAAGIWSATQHHRTITSSGFADCELSTTPYDTSVCNDPKESTDQAPHAARLLRPRKLTGNYPPPYPNGWFFLTASSDLAVSTSKYFSVAGLHIALFRDSKGKAHALDAYCPHLGANLAIGGTVKDDCIRCPFHGWTFRGSDGVCTNIPYSDCAPPEVAKVRTYHLREVNRMLYVWFDAEGRDPYWEIPVVPQLSDPNSNWVLHGAASHIVACHIQENPENGADVNHLEELHGDFTMKLLRPLGFRHHWTCQWTPGEEDNKHVTTLILSSTLKLKGIKVGPTRVAVSAFQIGPGIVHFSFKTPLGPVFAIQTVTPLEPLLQRVTHYMYSSPWTPPPRRQELLLCHGGAVRA